MDFFNALSTWSGSGVHFDQYVNRSFGRDEIRKVFGDEAILAASDLRRSEFSRAYRLPCVVLAEFRIDDAYVTGDWLDLFYEEIGSARTGAIKRSSQPMLRNQR